MKIKAGFFKKRNTQPNPPILYLPLSPLDNEDNLIFEVAVIGYTLKSYLYEDYEEKENAFLRQIKRDYSSEYYISKTFVDLAKDAKVTLNFLSDMDPLRRYECSRPNGISIHSKACIIFYDPTLDNCLSNLKKYFCNLLYLRKGHRAEDAIMCFVGINGDKPEKHKFKKTELLDLVAKHYDRNKISIYSLNLNPSPNCAENIEIILRNLTIACLKEYQKRHSDPFTITATESKLRPLSLPKSWETIYTFYTALGEGNKRSKEIFGSYLPNEIIKYMTLIFMTSIFQDYENPQLQFDIYREIFMDESAHLSEKLLITSKESAVTCNEKTKGSNENCSMM
ncbi:hypothetical protein BN59_02784 [Legionella massiliensis]|uniref:Uncharacterized protein n=2 Tax=Legionella massiliensis TaxID=1034943 RepID=A0A078L2Z7_9GAMM|nr:hypothetical protein BN59_02784 [Legionella massiliensis]CEE14212.1 hypothetical protein BN1094_02784 [Legionella massiliensis]